MKSLNKALAVVLIFTIGLLASPMVLAQTKVYRTNANASSPPELQVYDVDTNSWSTLASLPSNNTSQLATSDTDLFALPEDGNIYVYNPVNNSWELLMAGPAAAVGRHAVSMFETHDGEFYWGDDDTATLHYTVGGVWTSAQTPYQISSAADFDRVNGVLYIRTVSELGHFTFNPSTGTFGNGCPDTTSVGENSRAGVFYQGNFYTRTWSGNLIATNVATCVQTDTGVVLTTEHSSTAVDSLGNIYLNGYSDSENTFEVQSISGASVTPLADSPQLSGGNVHGSLAILGDGTTDFSSAVPVPAISQWGIALMILLLSMTTGLYLRARSRS
jgi:hypothetical protein